ncbi:hypothetical protein EW146_g1324 [Bondarzewia mesenterica]|uniref:N-alpha-acetyltransferase 60 n=1 Tax=Bondarzewia mesenterica TaxID=1095465 RepID=A0A4S4M4B3_9AGAM|nr:hypothetical protein EW146_g1324 [Bondarzewia mesenterica]
MSSPSSPLYSPVSLDGDFTIRHLSSADIPRVRELHSALFPLPLPTSFFQQLLVHDTRLCLVAVPTTSNIPVAFISAALHVTTNDLTISGAKSAPLEIHILTLGVAPEYRRQHLATRLLNSAIRTLRAQASLSTHLPSTFAKSHPYIRPPTGSEDSDVESEGEDTAITAHLPVNDAPARAFWKHVGLEEESTAGEPPRISGWRELVRMGGHISV